MKILISDDDDICRDMLVEMLSRAGYDVTSAADGAEAWELLQSHAFSVLISDWEMPGFSGPELCRRIRDDFDNGYIYSILLTGRDSSDDLVAGLQAGADAFISKPVTSSELLAQLQAAERIVSLETREVAIFALARLAESRDQETGEHLERVRNYARLIAQELAASGNYTDQIDTEFVRLLYLTSPLHDIGKVGIPDQVLLKPGRLTKEEMFVMQQHTRIGADTLDAALARFPKVRFLSMARDIAASHHERWDGTGYPDRIAREAIPLCARIVSVADVYDALTTKRCYKPAYAHETAVEIVRAGAGTQFDPVIVEAFARIHERIRGINLRFQAPSEEVPAKSCVEPIVDSEIGNPSTNTRDAVLTRR